MKHTKIVTATWLMLFSLFLSLSIFAQTDNYSCNITCYNQPDHVMEGVKVDLYNSNNQLIATTYTDDQGYFNFEDLNIGESYTAKFEYDVENNYVDIEDAFAILSHVLGFTELNDYQLIAANVDGNDVVDMHDFRDVLIYYVMQQSFPVGDWILPDWEFTLDGNKETGGPASGFSSGNINTADDDKSTNGVQTYYSDILEQEFQDVIKVPVYLNQIEEMSGIAIIAQFNNDLFDVISIESPIEDLDYSVSGNEIRLAWTDVTKFENKIDVPVVEIYIKQKQLSRYENIEHIEILNESHVLNAEGEKIPYIEFSSNEFKTASLSHSESTVYPNPCNDFFYIQLNEGIENAEYSLYNALGQMVDQRIISNSEQIEISTAGLQKGVYYYHINYQSKSITGPISIR